MSLDADTLQVILGRFDKIDEKLEAKLEPLAKGQADLQAKVTTIETKLEPVIADAAFKRKVDYVKTGLAGSIGAGLVMAFRFLFPHTPTK